MESFKQGAAANQDACICERPSKRIALQQRCKQKSVQLPTCQVIPADRAYLQAVNKPGLLSVSQAAVAIPNELSAIPNQAHRLHQLRRRGVEDKDT